MKFGFVTCVNLGLSCMEAVYEVGGQLDLVITLHDNLSIHKSGRCYVDQFCERHGIKLIKCSNVNDACVVAALKDLNIDWLYIIGWSQIAHNQVLTAARKGVVGAHPTLLPEGRGRASIPWAILKELPKTGVTLFKLDGGVDSGPIIDQVEILMDTDIDATDLYDKCLVAHGELIRKNHNFLKSNSVRYTYQSNTNATYWPGRSPSDGKIDFSLSVLTAQKLVRATTRPYPGAYYINDKGEKVVIWKSIVSSSYHYGSLKFTDGYLVPTEYENFGVV